MSYAFPPDLQRAVDEQMALGGYESADELLLDAVRALDHLQKQHDELRGGSAPNRQGWSGTV